MNNTIKPSRISEWFRARPAMQKAFEAWDRGNPPHSETAKTESKWLGHLTDEELLVMALRARGQTMTAIGRKIGKAAATVKQIETRGYRKLAARQHWKETCAAVAAENLLKIVVDKVL